MTAKTCHGCKYFRLGDSECSELQGVMWCPKCDRKYTPGEQLKKQESIGCPVCTDRKFAQDAAHCRDGIRSPCCPGYEAKAAPLPSQLNLFNFGD